jgi:hypothetical protein
MLEALSGLCRGEGGDAIVQVLAAQAPTWLLQFPAFLTPDHSESLRRELMGATRERMLREIGEALEAITLRSPPPHRIRGSPVGRLFDRRPDIGPGASEDRREAHGRCDVP